MSRAHAALIAALLSACASTPPPTPAELGVQTAWVGAPAEAEPSLDPAWWERFEDPALNQLIIQAQTRNLELRAAQARIREARALRAAAGAELLPSIQGEVSASRGRSLTGAGTDIVIRESASASAVASWELDLFGRLRNARDAASADLAASEADRDALRLSLLAELSRSYLDYQLYRVQHELAVKTAAAQADTLRITRARFAQGLGSRLDVERIAAQLATVRARVPQTQELAEAAFHRLVLLTATTPDALSAQLPAGTPSVADLPRADATAVLLSPTQVLAQRPDVRAAEQRLLAASAQLAASRALRYPQLSLSALIGVGSNEVDALLDDGTRVWSAGGGLLTPLFDFGRIRAAIDAADARQAQALLGFELSVRTALNEAQTALIQYTLGQQRQQELARAADASRIAADLARRQYAQGLLSLLEVLDAERSLYEAEQSWAEGTAAVSQRLVTLYQTMGVVPAG